MTVSSLSAATPRIHAETPDYVLRYFAHMDKAMAEELIRRSSVEAAAAIRAHFTTELATIARLQDQPNAWRKIVSFLCGRSMENKMRDFHVSIANFASVAGIRAPQSNL